MWLLLRNVTYPLWCEMSHALSSDLLGKHFRPTAFSSWPLLFSACDCSDPPLSARALAGKDGRCSKWNCIFSCLKTTPLLPLTGGPRVSGHYYLSDCLQPESWHTQVWSLNSQFCWVFFLSRISVKIWCPGTSVHTWWYLCIFGSTVHWRDFGPPSRQSYVYLCGLK